MIARTSPTLWDVLIALFGGIAGSIGNTRRKTSNVIPGVAIAAALIVTKLLGVPCKQELDAKKQKHVNRIITALMSEVHRIK